MVPPRPLHPHQQHQLRRRQLSTFYGPQPIPSFQSTLSKTLFLSFYQAASTIGREARFPFLIGTYIQTIWGISTIFAVPTTLILPKLYPSAQLSCELQFRSGSLLPTLKRRRRLRLSLSLQTFYVHEASGSRPRRSRQQTPMQREQRKMYKVVEEEEELDQRLTS